MIAEFGKFKVHQIKYESTTLLEIKLFGYDVDVIMVNKDASTEEKTLRARNSIRKWLENQMIETSK